MIIRGNSYPDDAIIIGRYDVISFRRCSGDISLEIYRHFVPEKVKIDNIAVYKSENRARQVYDSVIAQITEANEKTVIQFPSDGRLMER